MRKHKQKTGRAAVADRAAVGQLAGALASGRPAGQGQGVRAPEAVTHPAQGWQRALQGRTAPDAPGLRPGEALRPTGRRPAPVTPGAFALALDALRGLRAAGVEDQALLEAVAAITGISGEIDPAAADGFAAGARGGLPAGGAAAPYPGQTPHDRAVLPPAAAAPAEPAPYGMEPAPQGAETVPYGADNALYGAESAPYGAAPYAAPISRGMTPGAQAHRALCGLQAAAWRAQLNEVQAAYPSFSLDDALRDARFRRLVTDRQAPLRLKEAYEATHLDALRGEIARAAATRALEAQNRRAARPRESGAAVQAGLPLHPAGMTRREREALARRAARGERIVL